METRWKDKWRNVCVKPEVKRLIVLMAANDDIQQAELVEHLVEAEAQRRKQGDTHERPKAITTSSS